MKNQLYPIWSKKIENNLKNKLVKYYYGEENLHYGHFYILKKYTEIKANWRIPGYVQHGWTYGNRFKRDKNFDNVYYYVWNKRNLLNAKKDGTQNVIPIGAPFLYIENLNFPLPKNKKLLLFPMHSWEKEGFKDEIALYNFYLDKIKKMANHFSSITLCLYWTQYDNINLVNLIKKRGYHVVTLGHRDNNKQFLYNFVNLVRQFEYVSSNVFSTATFYSLFLKRKTFIYGHSYFNMRNEHGTGSELERNQPKLIKTYPCLLWENFDDSSYQDIGKEELGYEFKKSPEDLREIFGWGKSKIKSINSQMRFWKGLLRKSLSNKG